MRFSACTVIAATFTFLFVAAPSALAQERRLRLDYGSTVAGCADSGGLVDRVSARLGRSPFVNHDATTVTVRVTGTPTALRATLRIGGGARTNGGELHGSTCGEIYEAVATALAVYVDSAPSPRNAANDDANVAPRETRSNGPRVRVRATSNVPVALSRLVGVYHGWGAANGRTVSVTAVHMDPLCVSPCTFSLPTGQNTLGIGRVLRRVDIAHESHLRIRYEERSVWRIAGIAVTATGVLVGTIGIVAWAMSGGSSYDARQMRSVPHGQDGGLLALGIFGYSLVIPGMIGIFFDDSAHVEILPMRH